METDRKDHWTKVYRDKESDAVSWYQPNPEPSLRALERAGSNRASRFIDVGGGASSLVDALLAQGWQDLTVLDIAPSALEIGKQRLGADAAKVDWQVADVTEWNPSGQYDVWHDRAVYHFLTQPRQREAYGRALSTGLAPGGLVIMATFALDGPERCSGLPVERYDPEKLARTLGPSLRLLESWGERHSTPWGAEQAFTWCVFRSVV
jgi:2-polyprenyl-3-methyl-5-hydroxy-6-metoxy-1,4-benzoquinol methylase